MTTETQLLERWRLTRSPLLADALQPLATDAWVATSKQLARSAQSVAVDQLPPFLTDDPRVTVFLVEALFAARWPGASALPLWQRAFDHLVVLRDVRAIAPLKQALVAPPQFLGIAHTRNVLAKLEQTVTALEFACRDLPADDEVTKALTVGMKTPPAGGYFVRSKGRAAPPDALRLVERVWAAPDDDSVRLVVADALLELNDPWGEFISLQFRLATKKPRKPEDVKRADSLQLTHAQRIGGAIAHVATKEHWRFEKGFLVHCATDRTLVPRRRWDEALTAPHWATVRSVDLDLGQTPQWWVAAWIAGSRLTSLREITIGSIQLTRDALDAPWTVARAKKALHSGELKVFTGLARGLGGRVTTTHAQLLPVLEKVSADAKSSAKAKRPAK